MLNANRESERASLSPPFRQLAGLRTYRIRDDIARTLNVPCGGADAHACLLGKGCRSGNAEEPYGGVAPQRRLPRFGFVATA